MPSQMAVQYSFPQFNSDSNNFTTPFDPSTLHQSTRNQPTLADQNLRTIPELLTLRSILTPNTPLLSCLSKGHQHQQQHQHLSNNNNNNNKNYTYTTHTALDLSFFAHRAARDYALHFPPRQTSATQPKTIALLGPSDLSSIVALLALWHLGHTVLLLSPELALDAQMGLLTSLGVHELIHHPASKENAVRIENELMEFWVYPFVDQLAWDYTLPVPAGQINGWTGKSGMLDLDRESEVVAVVLHEFGDEPGNGEEIPKPSFYTHKALLSFAGNMNINLRGYSCVPIYEQLGLIRMLQSIHAGASLYLHDFSSGAFPLTAQYLQELNSIHNFGVLYCNENVLGPLAGSDEGVRDLNSFEIVVVGAEKGLRRDLGDRLVEAGVFLVCEFGVAELGPLMSSLRRKEDKSWQYMKLYPVVRPYIKFEDRGDGLLELIVLEGLSTRSVPPNRPDGSFASTLLFRRHPAEDAYVYCPRH